MIAGKDAPPPRVVKRWRASEPVKTWPREAVAPVRMRESPPRVNDSRPSKNRPRK